MNTQQSWPLFGADRQQTDHDDGGEENVEQLTWQLILCDKHSHEHRPIGRILDLETF